LIGLALLTGFVTVLVIAAYVVAVGLALRALAPDLGTVAVVALGLLALLPLAVIMAWLWVRLLYLPASALMIERTGVMGALGRSWRLTREHFWRTFGIAVLTMLIVQMAASMLAFPLTLGSELVIVVAPEYAMVALVLGQALASVVTATIVYPFSSTVTTLQYVDLRIRKEGFDLELLEATGGRAS
jgi:membrane-anchored glycerophosphoryl diester phosphodiesterase (GDPDase)